MTPSDNQISSRWTLRLILLNVCIGQAIVGLDQRALLVALPTLTESFHTHLTTIQWTLLIYDLILIGLVITMGRLGDLFGRRRFYSLGFLLFVIGSALCGIAQSPAQLIFFRAVQAVGGSMISANGRAIASMSVPIGLWGAYLAWKIMAETKEEGEKVSIDFLGAFLLLVTNSLFIYAIDQIPRLGWHHPTFLLTISFSAVALALLIITELRSATPILLLHLFYKTFIYCE